MTPRPLFLLTGESGSGKTSACQALVQRVRQAGGRVAGLLSPPIIHREEKVAIAARLLPDDQQRLLAVRQSEAPAWFSLALGQWQFDPSILARVDRHLENLPPCDLLIVDEIGPLELVRGEGWQAALPALRHHPCQAALVVVRPSLIEVACRLLPVTTLVSVAETGNLDAIFTVATGGQD
jgi:nucleoside-triphosphatase THEP1